MQGALPAEGWAWAHKMYTQHTPPGKCTSQGWCTIQMVRYTACDTSEHMRSMPSRRLCSGAHQPMISGPLDSQASMCRLLPPPSAARQHQQHAIMFLAGGCAATSSTASRRGSAWPAVQTALACSTRSGSARRLQGRSGQQRVLKAAGPLPARAVHAVLRAAQLVAAQQLLHLLRQLPVAATCSSALPGALGCWQQQLPPRRLAVAGVAPCVIRDGGVQRACA
jgi:hypothetical protein